MRRIMRSIIPAFIIVGAAALCGCSTPNGIREHYSKGADKEVYRLLEQKSSEVQGSDPSFTIEQMELPELANLPVSEHTDKFMGDEELSGEAPRVISLEKALEIAVKHSRSYQSEKESLYLNALSLTSARHNFRPNFTGKAGTNYNRSTHEETIGADAKMSSNGTTAQSLQVERLIGTPGQLLKTYSDLVQSAAKQDDGTEIHQVTVEDKRISGNSSFGVSLLLAGGTEIALNLASDFTRFLTGTHGLSTGSTLSATLTQPLLKGAGRKVARESLTQAERDLLYQLRSFARFRKTFSVKTASSYYQVLQARDRVYNDWRGYQDTKTSAELQSLLAEAGRVTESDAARFKQNELTAKDDWNASIRDYKGSLDKFKVELGLPADANVVLDSQELERMLERGIVENNIFPDDAVEIGLAARLDLYNSRDRTVDSARRLEIAANGLLPALDLQVSWVANTRNEDSTGYRDFDFKRSTWNAGLDLREITFDRKRQRNTYKSALISYDRASRSLDDNEDNIRLDVRNSWRRLEQAMRSFEINKDAVELNERRVEEQELLTEAGRASALDMIDAQNELVRARNALTSSLVNHNTTLLTFWTDMGILYIKENGQWEEVKDVPSK